MSSKQVLRLSREARTEEGAAQSSNKPICDPNSKNGSLEKIPQSNAPPALLNLPLEIRYMIYGHLLWSPHLVIISLNPSCHRDQSILAPLLRTNRQIRGEINTWLWSNSGPLSDWHERRSRQKFERGIWCCDKNTPAHRPLGLCSPSTTTVVIENLPGRAEVLPSPLGSNGWEDIAFWYDRIKCHRGHEGNLKRCNVRSWKYLCLTEEMKNQLMNKRKFKVGSSFSLERGASFWQL